MIKELVGAIAQAVSPLEVNWQTLLLGYGPIGAILYWFANTGTGLMREMIAEIRIMGHRINGMQRVQLMEMMEREVTQTPGLKDMARREMERLQREDEDAANLRKISKKSIFRRGEG